MTRGFIALLTVILVSAVLLALVSAANLAAFLSRSSQLNNEQHATALALAEACQQIAFMNLAQNSAYNPMLESHQIDTNTCLVQDVVQVSGSGAAKVVRVDTSARDGESFATVSASVRISLHAAPQILATFEQ